MKTKNILICGLIGALIGGGANALDTSEIKAKCEQSDKTVWVEATKVCVPKNPCKNDKYSAYCDKEFADVKFINTDQARLFVRMYLLYSKDVEISNGAMGLLSSPGVIGQDYMTVWTQDGNYIVFEIDSLNASNQVWRFGIGEHDLGRCDDLKPGHGSWHKMKSNVLPEFCVRDDVDAGTMDVVIKKENIKGNSIDDVAHVFRELYPSLFIGRYGESVENGVDAYYIK